MNFAGYILKTGLYVGARSDVMEIMLYNGRRVLVFGCTGDDHGRFFIPRDLVQFHCGRNGADIVDLEVDQKPGTYYKLSWDWSTRITDEETIKTFFQGVGTFNVSTIPRIILDKIFRLSANPVAF